MNNDAIRLSYCKTCKKKGFNPRFGIVCSLTNERGQFENNCNEYDENNSAYQDIKIKNSQSINTLRTLDKNNDTVISSRWTKIAFVFSILTPLLPFLAFFLVGWKSGFNRQETVGSIAFGTILIVLPVIYSRFTIALIRGNKLILKRLFGKENEVEFSDIKDVNTFQLKRTKFISCKIKRKNSSEETFTILNSKSLLSFGKKDAESVLIALKNYDSLKRFI